MVLLLRRQVLRPLITIRSFSYDKWYKVESERQKRINKKAQDFVKDKS
ncbi:unnamed protein product, partial [Brachionus calyciflorus]